MVKICAHKKNEAEDSESQRKAVLCICKECLSFPCAPRCPNYVSPKAEYYCDICGEGIYDGEEYIRNDEGNHAHWDCLYTAKDLAEWIGIDIKTMEG